MKRIILAILILLAWAGIASAAGTCVESGDNPTRIYDTSGNISNTGDEILLLCTHHTDNSLSAELSSTIMEKLAGWYSWQVISFPGGTAPTDDTDLEISEEMTDTIGLSLLGSNGTDFIDATTAKETLFYISSIGVNIGRMAVPSRPWTVSTSGNTVASAEFYLLIRRAP